MSWVSPMTFQVLTNFKTSTSGLFRTNQHSTYVKPLLRWQWQSSRPASWSHLLY